MPMTSPMNSAPSVANSAMAQAAMSQIQRAVMRDSFQNDPVLATA